MNSVYHVPAAVLLPRANLCISSMWCPAAAQVAAAQSAARSRPCACAQQLGTRRRYRPPYLYCESCVCGYTMIWQFRKCEHIMCFILLLFQSRYNNVAACRYIISANHEEFKTISCSILANLTLFLFVLKYLCFEFNRNRMNGGLH